MDTIEIKNLSGGPFLGQNISLPLGNRIVLSGPTGSGKSTFVRELLLREARGRFDHFAGISELEPGSFSRSLTYDSFEPVVPIVDLSEQILALRGAESIFSYLGIDSLLGVIFREAGVARCEEKTCELANRSAQDVHRDLASNSSASLILSLYHPSWRWSVSAPEAEIADLVVKAVFSGHRRLLIDGKLVRIPEELAESSPGAVFSWFANQPGAKESLDVEIVVSALSSARDEQLDQLSEALSQMDQMGALAVKVYGAENKTSPVRHITSYSRGLFCNRCGVQTHSRDFPVAVRDAKGVERVLVALLGGKLLQDLAGLTATEFVPVLKASLGESAKYFTTSLAEIERRVELFATFVSEEIALDSPGDSLSYAEALRLTLLRFLIQRNSGLLFTADYLVEAFSSKELSRVVDLIDRIIGEGNSFLIVSNRQELRQTGQTDSVLISLGDTGTVMDATSSEEVTEPGNTGGKGQKNASEVSERLFEIAERNISFEFRDRRRRFKTFAEVVYLASGIAKVFASLGAARRAGLGQKHFSIANVDGRCELCGGSGVEFRSWSIGGSFEICAMCNGERFSEDVLAIEYQEHSIADVYNATVTECLSLFASEAKLVAELTELREWGFGDVIIGELEQLLPHSLQTLLYVRQELGRSTRGKKKLLLPALFLDKHQREVAFGKISSLASTTPTIVSTYVSG